MFFDMDTGVSCHKGLSSSLLWMLDTLGPFVVWPQGSAGDRRALHASCPTLKGTKWTATKWIHSKIYMGEGRGRVPAWGVAHG